MEAKKKCPPFFILAMHVTQVTEQVEYKRT